ncbi:putative gustatory receptor 28b [Haliotis rufescens]|uniref:putative gustatory receptor 28b n=1 Tax=Haliotis rufescens TaxID=6454 RepID=UPI00201FA65A|nr:putative gustatory receptor 28b [Haliotis rufescens]
MQVHPSASNKLSISDATEICKSVFSIQAACSDSVGNAKQKLKVLLTCLRLTGFLYYKPKRGERNRKDFVSKIYCSTVLLILWINFGFATLYFKDMTVFNGVLCNVIVSTVWFFQAACFVTNNFFRCHLVEDFLYDLDSYLSEVSLDMYRSLKNASLALSISYFIWLGCAFTFGGLANLFVSDSPFDGTSFGAFVILKIFLAIVYFYFVSSWYLLMSLFVLLSYILYRSFTDLNTRLSNVVNQDGCCRGDLEIFRLQHHRVCLLLEKANAIFSVYVLITIGTVIPLIVFTLYFVIFESIEMFKFFAVWWSVSLAVLQLLVVFVCGALVNHYAHASLWQIFGVDLHRFTSEQSQQACMFVSQLTSHPIGFTAMGLFVIDKPTIVTFVGTIITYTVVIIQFKPGSD